MICIRKISTSIQLASKMSVKSAKTQVRKEIEEKLSKLSKEEKIRQSKNVFEKLLQLKEFQKCQRVSVFLSTDGEVDTEPMVRKIFEMGKKCYVPRYSKAGMDMVQLNSMEDWETLPLTKWNIKQPSLKDKRENALESGGLDFVIVPGVAFTKSGSRLGHGGGYYDRYLRNLTETQKEKPSFVAVAFKEQILDKLPLEETDFQIDLVLTSD